MRSSGSAAMASSSVRKLAINRAIVDASKRSLLYSTNPRRSRGLNSMSSRRSNFATVPSIVDGSKMFCGSDCTLNTWKLTWKSGLRLRSRSGCSSSTSFSKGTS